MTKRILFFCVNALLLGILAKAQTVTVDDVCVEPGKTGEFTVCLSGGQSHAYTLMTLYVQFPKDAGITTVDDFELIYPVWKESLVSEADLDKTSLSAGTLGVVGDVDADGLAIIPFASTEALDCSSKEQIVKIRFNLPANTGYGTTYNVTLKGAEFGYNNMETPDIAADVTFKVVAVKLSDANCDKASDIADAVSIVNHVVGKPNAKFIGVAADANRDGDIDIADAVRIVNFVVGKIPALAPRFGWNLPEPE